MFCHILLVRRGCKGKEPRAGWPNPSPANALGPRVWLGLTPPWGGGGCRNWGRGGGRGLSAAETPGAVTPPAFRDVEMRASSGKRPPARLAVHEPAASTSSSPGRGSRPGKTHQGLTAWEIPPSRPDQNGISAPHRLLRLPWTRKLAHNDTTITTKTPLLSLIVLL